MEISFIHMQILVHLQVNKTNFHVKGFTLGLTLKQRQNETRKSPITSIIHGVKNYLLDFMVYHKYSHSWM